MDENQGGFMRGRRPTPSNLKIIRGTWRRDRARVDEPQPAPELLPCPEFLSPKAKEEWNRLGPELFELGLLTKLDRAAFSVYCQAFANWHEASEKLESEGAVRTTKRGDMVKSPWVTIERHAFEELLLIAREFGMTPSSRGRVSVAVSSDPAEDDDLLS